eukprot:m51a1_g9805 hypothetical protein (409) ;mRNA; f:1815270-1817008
MAAGQRDLNMSRMMLQSAQSTVPPSTAPALVTASITAAAGPAVAATTVVAVAVAAPLPQRPEDKFPQMTDTSDALFLRAFFDASYLAEESREDEWLAARGMQALVRTAKVLRQAATVSGACCGVQAIMRARTGRAFLDRLLLDLEKESRMKHYNDCATRIQKIFRGHRMRKWDRDKVVSVDGLINNFYARKALIEKIEAKNAEMRERSAAALEEQMQQQMEEKRLQATRQFQDEAAKLHYLVSTRTQPGVFSPVPPPDRETAPPPPAALFAVSALGFDKVIGAKSRPRKPCAVLVDAVPLEEHLRANPAFKTSLGGGKRHSGGPSRSSAQHLPAVDPTLGMPGSASPKRAMSPAASPGRASRAQTLPAAGPQRGDERVAGVQDEAMRSRGLERLSQQPQQQAATAVVQ